MPTWTFELESLADTESLGKAIAALLEPSDIVRLVGDLGAGKTTLTRAIAVAMGADASLVNSPTYVFLNHYPTAESRPNLAHMDCYRMSGPGDLETVGWDTVVESSDAVLIEWPERIASELPEEGATVTLEHAGETHDSEKRVVRVELPERWVGRAGMRGFGGMRGPLEDSEDHPPRTETICPASGVRVAADSPTWPFANERLQMADLYKWFSGQHAISRPLDHGDLEE